jgi:DHA1 family multidrug resistance protein-like MFS transporter
MGFAQRLRMIGALPGMAGLVMVLMACQFAVQAVQPVVTLYVQDIVGDQPNIATLGGVALSVTGLAGVIAVPLLSRSGDRFGERPVLMVALAGAALMSLPQSWAGSYLAFVAERLGLGLFIGAIVPVSNALIGKLTPSAERGTTFGLTSSAYFLGNSLGPMAGGVVAATVGLPWVFMMTSVLLAAGLAAVALAVPSRRG